MTNKEAYIELNKLYEAYQEQQDKDEKLIKIDDIQMVALCRALYNLRKLCRMADDLAEEYVDLLDIDYPPRDDFWDGYNKGYHDCEVELQAKEKQDGE